MEANGSISDSCSFAVQPFRLFRTAIEREERVTAEPNNNRMPYRSDSIRKLVVVVFVVDRKDGLLKKTQTYESSSSSGLATS